MPENSTLVSCRRNTRYFGSGALSVLSQKAEKQPAMFSFVGEKIDYRILRYVIESLCQMDDLLVLADGYFIRVEDSPDHCQHISVVRRWLQQILISRQRQRTRQPAAQNIDSLRQATRVLQLEGDLVFE